MGKWEELSKSYKKNEKIYSQGEKEGSIFVIRKGRINIERKINDKVEIVREAREGEIIGISSTLSNSPRIYTAKAIEDDTTVVELPPHIFNNILNKNPEISINILKNCSKRILDIEGKLFASGKQVDEQTKEKTDEGPLPVLTIHPSNRKYTLSKEINTVGRKVPSINYSPDVDLSDEDKGKFISRRHAVIFFDEKEYFIKEEMGVINGTFLNNKKLKAGIPYKLSNNDKIRFCNIEATFEIQE